MVGAIGWLVTIVDVSKGIDTRKFYPSTETEVMNAEIALHLEVYPDVPVFVVQAWKYS